LPARKTLGVVASIAGSFTGLAGLILFLLIRQTLSFEIAMLMFATLLGMYVGFGMLIAIYLLILKLD
jgi:hypothetical protein